MVSIVFDNNPVLPLLHGSMPAHFSFLFFLSHNDVLQIAGRVTYIFPFKFKMSLIRNAELSPKQSVHNFLACFPPFCNNF